VLQTARSAIEPLIRPKRSSASSVQSREWRAHLVGAFRVHPHQHWCHNDVAIDRQHCRLQTFRDVSDPSGARVTRVLWRW